MAPTFKTSLSLFLALGSVAYAQNDRRGPGRGGRPGRGYPPAVCRAPNNSFVYVGQQINGRGVLPVRELLGLNRECEGVRVRSVILLARSLERRGYSQASLFVNGYAAGRPETLSQGASRQIYLFLNPGMNELGREVNTLQVLLEGSSFVEYLAVDYDQGSAGPGPRPGPQPQPGPRPGPQPGPRPGPYPGPQPGPRPPVANAFVWANSTPYGYYDTTGRLQGAYRLAQMRQFGGHLASGEPVPMHQVLVNEAGHICGQPGFPNFQPCSWFVTHYE